MPNVSVLSVVKPDGSYDYVSLGKEFKAEEVLNISDLHPDDIGVEMLFATSDNKGKLHIQEKYEFAPVDYRDETARYQASVMPERAGLYQVAVRIYAKNPLLPHRQDFELVRWL